MRRALFLALLTACTERPSRASQLRAELAGVWHVAGTLAEGEHVPAGDRSTLMTDLAPNGDLLMLPGCQSAGTDCTDSLRGLYKDKWSRPANKPRCDPARVELTEDSVVIVLGPGTDHARRELRGVLTNGQLRGDWVGTSYIGWLKGTFVLNRISRGGLTSACS
jgi:hypothetical protein